MGTGESFGRGGTGEMFTVLGDVIGLLQLLLELRIERGRGDGRGLG